MSIILNKLVYASKSKSPAIIDFKMKSHLVFGPTETGKSFIVESVKYALGSNEKPRDIGYSDEYTMLFLQFVVVETENKYTFVRELKSSNEIIYPGFHETIPDVEAIEEKISKVLVSFANGEGYSILTKAGVIGSLTAGDMRHISLFDEIETLDKVPLEGKDSNLKVRNRASFSLVMSGVDDSDIKLVPKTDERNVAKGRVESLTEQIDEIKALLPEKLSREAIKALLEKADEKIEALSNYIKSNAEILKSIKITSKRHQEDINEFSTERSALNEALERFKVLDEKYTNDLMRLESINRASLIVPEFELSPCPICNNPIDRDASDLINNDIYKNISLATEREVEKTRGLQIGLYNSVCDIQIDLEKIDNKINTSESLLEESESKYFNLMNGVSNLPNDEFDELTDNKSDYQIWLRDYQKLDDLKQKLLDAKEKAKRKKQVVDRNLSKSSKEICDKIKYLLDIWKVPDVDQVFFDKDTVDILINQRKRISYGKGKRGILLTALIISLMEHALENGYPHLGFVMIDSPVVTYKDPKHGSNNPNEALDSNVKDSFYKWLVARKGQGQIIIIENEEPDSTIMKSLGHTEFMGYGGATGRKGFFPT